MGLLIDVFGGVLGKKKPQSENPFAGKDPEKMFFVGEERTTPQGNSAKKKTLENEGVDVSKLTSKKANLDAAKIVAEFCGIGGEISYLSLKVEWQNLTAKGNIPKKVAETTIELKSSGKDCIIHVWYQKEIEPYAANVYVWKGSKCRSYYIRQDKKSGKLFVDNETLDHGNGFVENVMKKE